MPPNKRLPPPVFRRVPFWEYGGLKPILPFLGGRSDAARRVVILPFALPVDAHVVANDGRWRCIATVSSPMPTVGARIIFRNAKIPPPTPPPDARTVPTTHATHQWRPRGLYICARSRCARGVANTKDSSSWLFAVSTSCPVPLHSARPS